MSTRRSLGDTASALLNAASQYIDGVPVEGAGEPLAVVDPTTEQTLASVPTATVAQVDAAVASARRAFDGGLWSRLRPGERSLFLHRIAERLDAHRDALAEIVVAEGGSPISLARSLQVGAAIEHLAWFADAAARGPAGAYEHPLPRHAGPPASEGVLVYEPIGVVAAITPYNIPLLTAVWKAAAALAAGCTTVLLPSPQAPLASAAFAALVAEADLPPGAFNFLIGAAAAGRRLSEHPDVDMITFTGSNAVGLAVAQQAAPTFKRVVLELGGKSPNVVLPGAQVDETLVTASLLRFCRNAGQACGATTRTFVPRAAYDDYVDIARGMLAQVPVGDPWDEQTAVGPLISAPHRDRVQGFVDRALAAGGRIEAQGDAPATSGGFFMSPALLGGVDNRAEIARTELFGPIGLVFPYDDVEQMLRLANDSPYGLNANVWGPLPEAQQVARGIRSGTVTINGGGWLRSDAPFGGYRHSGNGREAGEEGFREFFEVKHVQWPAQG